MNVAKALSITALALTSSTVVGALSLPEKADAFTIAGGGYVATNQLQIPFIDISKLPTSTRLLQNQDDAAANANIGFKFPFFGSFYRQIGVSTNGLLSFLGLNSNPNNTNLLQNPPALPTISALWDNWNVQSPAAVYTQSMRIRRNRFFIVQWNQVFNNNGQSNLASFQAILFRNGSILLNYQGFGDLAGSATIGINGLSPFQRLQWSYNTPFSTYPAQPTSQSIWFFPNRRRR